MAPSIDEIEEEGGRWEISHIQVTTRYQPQEGPPTIDDQTVTHSLTLDYPATADFRKSGWQHRREHEHLAALTTFVGGDGGESEHCNDYDQYHGR